MEAFGSLIKWIAESREDKQEIPAGSFWHSVKLIRPEDLRQWGAVKIYDEHDSITFAEYKAKSREVRYLKRRPQIRELIKKKERLGEIQTDAPVTYNSFEIDIPR